MKSRNFPGFPDDHRIITDPRNFRGFRNYGEFRKFGNVRSIVDKTRINPCIVKINHGNITELSRKIHGTSGDLKYQSHKISAATAKKIPEYLSKYSKVSKSN